MALDRGDQRRPARLGRTPSAPGRRLAHSSRSNPPRRCRRGRWRLRGRGCHRRGRWGRRGCPAVRCRWGRRGRGFRRFRRSWWGRRCRRGRWRLRGRGCHRRGRWGRRGCPAVRCRWSLIDLPYLSATRKPIYDRPGEARFVSLQGYRCVIDDRLQVPRPSHCWLPSLIDLPYLSATRKPIYDRPGEARFVSLQGYRCVAR